MIETVQLAGLTASLICCIFWLAAAGVRIRPFSLFNLRGPDSIPAAMQRQSLLNAFAAIFAAFSAAAQSFAFYYQQLN